MPELPDIAAYVHALEPRIVGRSLGGLRVLSPFVLRSVALPPAALAGREVVGLRRLGKRIVLVFAGERFAVVHLMIAGRLRWKPPGVTLPRRLALAAFDFADGTLWLTEAARHRRASLHLVQGEAELTRHDPRGLRRALRGRARLRRAAGRRAPHAQACADRSAAVLRNRQRLFRRDPPPRTTVAAAADRPARTGGGAAPARRGAGGPRRVDRTAARRGGRRLSRARHRVSPGDGRARPARPSVPGLRGSGAAHRLRRQRVQLLRDLPDGRVLADRALSRLLGADWPRTLDELEARFNPPGGQSAPD